MQGDECLALERSTMAIRSSTVVVVDDDSSIRMAMTRLLKSSGLNSLTFESAEAFLDSDQLNSAACLIIDVQMPGMRGLELQQICSKRHPDLPIIMISAFNDDGVEQRAADAGAKAFFHKPFDAAAVIGLVKELLANQN
jgi:FixJ family two-component response regulator